MNHDKTNVELRSQLINKLQGFIQAHQMTQTKAAGIFGVSQPRVSDIMQHKSKLFTIDSLVNMLTNIGYDVSLDIKPNQIEN